MFMFYFSSNHIKCGIKLYWMSPSKFSLVWYFSSISAIFSLQVNLYCFKNDLRVQSLFFIVVCWDHHLKTFILNLYRYWSDPAGILGVQSAHVAAEKHRLEWSQQHRGFHINIITCYYSTKDINRIPLLLLEISFPYQLKKVMIGSLPYLSFSISVCTSFYGIQSAAH